MKIAIATDAWHPQISGVVTTLTRTILEIQNLGHEVCCITPDRFKPTIPCPTYPQIRLAVNPRRKLAQILGEFRPNCIHIVTEGPIGLACRLYCVKRGLRFTTSFTTRFDEYVYLRFGIPIRITSALLRWFHRPASQVMVSTLPLKDELEGKWLLKTALWPRGVDTDLFRPREKDFLTDPGPVFMYVGRVAVEKSIEDFLKLNLPGTKYVVGDGPALPRLKIEYPEVRFVGAKVGEELARFYSAADVFIFPSRTDTFGIVMLEALACGVPVAGYPVRGPIDIVKQGETGYVDEDLGKAATQALTLDPDGCRKFAMQFSWKKSAEHFVENLVNIR